MPCARQPASTTLRIAIGSTRMKIDAQSRSARDVSLPADGQAAIRSPELEIGYRALRNKIRDVRGVDAVVGARAEVAYIAADADVSDIPQEAAAVIGTEL